ncbi:response regulator [Chondromyces crocatus]|uniref:Chemotaxis protein CheY n=1 Tax=Chondromyces crocatus TaxID=52 RepID=A0A0K1ESZ6_CHOCO|nr:response regulator [Chondromyces crocatus]AKT43738.1 chemotaxis protein CheY [Chondromyces crocatus]
MKTVLIVDDEFDIADALAAIFEVEGYAVRVCSNGLDAMKEIARSLPDLLLLDVMMPVMDGLEVLSRLRSDDRTSDLPVIVMSAVKPKQASAGAPWQLFLQKPFNITALLVAVQGLIGSPVGAEHAEMAGGT